MAKRNQRAGTVGSDIRRVNATPSASVPGRREVVADAPVKARDYLRSAHQIGAAVARVCGGGVSDAPTWSGPDGPGKDLGRISVNSPRKS